MQNDQQFIQLFNQLEDELKKILGLEYHIGFSELVDNAAEVSSVVSEKASKIKAFGRLRNAIVHNHRSEAMPIAVPHQVVLEELQDILKKVTNPPTVIEHFKTKVYCAANNDKVKTVVSTMIENDYSLVPIVKNGTIIGTLTTEHFLKGMHFQDYNNQHLTIDGFVEFLKGKGLFSQQHHRVIEEKTNIYEARAIMIRSMDEGKPYDSLIITRDGRSQSKPSGIITRSDDLGKLWDLVKE
jgi:CBS domain-containing protein